MAVASHSMPTLWVTYEESLGDVVRRFAGFDANPANVLVFDRPAGPEIERAIEQHAVRYVVIDSFAAYVGAVHGKAPATHESENWQQLTLQLKDLAHRTGAAVVTLAHTSKSDVEGGIRGSTGIAAAADLIVRVANPRKSDPDNLRRLTFLGRWTVDKVQVRYAEDGYTTDRDQPFEAEGMLASVYHFVSMSTKPPSGRRIRDQVKGKTTEINEAVNTLVERGALMQEKVGRGFAYTALQVDDALLGEAV
jgi:hypothetical protein